METVGIVAEYNPFHAGHAYHIRQSRARTGAENVVCVLSGDFVQRGEAAAFSKFARAEAAVRGGADLVIELPLPWCLASAEGYARGAAGLLCALGVVDALSFGSECGDAAALSEIAAALTLPETEERLREELKAGVSFAAAREKAVAALLGGEKAALMAKPNNILGIEYAKTLSLLRSPMTLLTVPRQGSEHDGLGSASELRQRLFRGENVLPQLPESCRAVFAREIGEGRAVSMAALEEALLSRLRMLNKESFARLPDASEGLENLLYAAAREEGSVEAILARCKSRRYALSRLRRMLLCAALGVEKGMTDGLPPYIRPLCANERGKALLHEIKRKSPLPILSRGGAVRELDEKSRAIFELGSRAHDFYVLGCSGTKNRRSDEDYRNTTLFL